MRYLVVSETVVSCRSHLPRCTHAEPTLSLVPPALQCYVHRVPVPMLGQGIDTIDYSGAGVRALRVAQLAHCPSTTWTFMARVGGRLAFRQGQRESLHGWGVPPARRPCPNPIP